MTTDAKPKRGPPFKPAAEVRVQRSIRLLPRHWQKIDDAGKAAFEAHIEAWRPVVKDKNPTKKPAA